ncbi:MAG: hypothetical protein LUE17_00835 [Planctomycetaceae bacterium]|nr:hypothetical protein [Planctomycetaceae bacterium]
MPNRWKEREQAIMNGIMSLVVNECDALECLKKEGGDALYEGIACKVRPTLQVCASEAAQVQAELDAARRDVEAKRFALENVVANMDVPEGPVKDALRAALPGHPFLGKGA